MALGCFNQSQSQQQQQQETTPVNEQKDFESNLILNQDNTLLLVNNSTLSLNDDKNQINSSETNLFDSNKNKETLFVSYDDEINLDEIPLPSSPAPKQSQSFFQSNDAGIESDDENDEQYDKESNTSSEEDEDSVLDTESSENKKNSNFLRTNNKKNKITIKNLKFYDTVDSFEILEQTILKQKRLAKLKNTDLRKKILLKRTFDLVCEIMDHENGFEQDDEESVTDSNNNKQLNKFKNENKIVNSNSSSSSSSSSSDSSSDSSDEEQDDLETNKMNLVTVPDQTIPKENSQQLTIIKLEDQIETINTKPSNLEDLYLNLDLVEFRFEDYLECQPTQIVQAQVPNKRRLSNSDESEEEEEDEYEMEYLLKEQQLNSSNTNLSMLNSVQFNIYNDNNSSNIKKRPRIDIEQDDDKNNKIDNYKITNNNKKLKI